MQMVIGSISIPSLSISAKYVGTGHAGLNRFEWAVNIQRDNYASYGRSLPHNVLFCHSGERLEESVTTVCRYLHEMLLPCGLPPNEKKIKKCLYWC
ncbi:hypothetical protein MKW92_028365 [Papaver armeniacum]|nr:hypothetical protein MKW92_028365 [Papaver armeniacum]